MQGWGYDQWPVLFFEHHTSHSHSASCRPDWQGPSILMWLTWNDREIAGYGLKFHLEREAVPQ